MGFRLKSGLAMAFFLVTYGPTAVISTPSAELDDLRADKFALKSPERVVFKIKANRGNRVRESIVEKDETGISSLDRVLRKRHVKRLRPLIGKRSKRDEANPRTLKIENLYNIDVEADELSSVVEELRNDPSVEYVQPDFLLKLNMVSSCDPLTKPGLTTPTGSWGQNYPNGWNLIQTKVKDAWNLSRGAGTKIAIIDTGINLTHEDLANQIWVNSGEIPANGIDDDANGFIDDVNGYDFSTCLTVATNGSCAVPKDRGPDASDPIGHGSHVAGIAAATSGNKFGLYGVAPDAKIMAIRIFSQNGVAYSSDVLAAVHYAVDSGADVINGSFGTISFETDYALEAAFTYASDHGVVSVVAAGNETQDAVNYIPASYDTVISVAANTHRGGQASFTNYGDSVAVSAPGSGIPREFGGTYDNYNIISTLPDAGSLAAGTGQNFKVQNGYYRLAGTSMAAPHVAGAVALMIARNRAQGGQPISPAEAKLRIMASASPFLESPWDPIGAGILDAHQALVMEPRPFFARRQTVLTEISGDMDQTPDPGDVLALNLHLENLWVPTTGASAVLSTSSLFLSPDTSSHSFLFNGGTNQWDNSADPFTISVGAIPNGSSIVPFSVVISPVGFPDQTLSFFLKISHSDESPAYTFTLLAEPSQFGKDGEGYAINDSGRIVIQGHDLISALPTGLLWDNGSLTPLSPPSGYTGVFVRDINSSNTVLGNSNGNPLKSYLIDQGALSFITGTSSLPRVNAISLNDSGEATGTIAAGNSLPRYAVYWDGSTSHQLPDLSGSTLATGWQINSSGVICGISADRAVYWQDGVVHRLLGSNNSVSACFSINDAGESVGTVTESGTRVPVIFQGGSYQVLQSAPGTTGCQPVKINNSGVIIGFCYLAPRTRAVVWQDAGATPSLLEDLIPGLSGFEIGWVNDVNSLGDIVGAAYPIGDPYRRTFPILMQPLPNP